MALLYKKDTKTIHTVTDRDCGLVELDGQDVWVEDTAPTIVYVPSAKVREIVKMFIEEEM